MSDTVISVEGLGKQYRIGAAQERYVALRDVFSRQVRQLGRRVFRGHRAAPKYEEFWALTDVSFEVEQGECVGIIGRNGAGKSTLLKLLSRITEPTTGRFRVRGRVASLLEVGTGFHPELTGRENVYLNGAILGMKRAEIARKFDEIVAFADVEKFLDTPVKYYSSGMYMRLAFAVAAHLEPEILIVDEVLAVGDAEFQKKCLGKMGTVARSGRTVLFVSHNMGAIGGLCQRAICLQRGQVYQTGDVRSVVASYHLLTATGTKHFPNEALRVGSGEARFIAAKAEQDLYKPEEAKVIQFTVQWRSQGLPRLYTSALIKDEHGAIIAQCDSRLVGFVLERRQEADGKLIVRSPWLKPGEYHVDLVLCAAGSGIIDWVERATSFRVSSILPYAHTASAEAIAHGAVLADFDWTTSHAPRPARGINDE